MKRLQTRALLTGMAGFAFCLLLSFTLRPGGYSYTLHLNSKVVGEHYLTSSFQTPTLALTNQNLTGTLSVYFNECGQIGQDRKLSLRNAEQKILKEWSFANSTTKHDAMEVNLKEVSGLLNSGKVGIYYASERLNKPQIMAYLSTAEAVAKK